jgi:hypothetical protein
MALRLLRHPAVALLMLALAACAASPGGGESRTPSTVASAPDTDGSSSTASAPPADDGGEIDESGLGTLPEGTPGACELLTVEEVASVVGHPVEADGDIDGYCSWSGADPETGLYASVSVAPLPQRECVDYHVALGGTELFEYEEADFGVPAFASYRETMAGTHIATFEVCTLQVHLGVRVEGQEPDEAGHQAMAAQLVEMALERLEGAIGS